MTLAVTLFFFTIPIAEMIGFSGSVIFVDLQEEMLEILNGKFLKTKYRNRVALHKCSANTLHLNPSTQVDFILTYYMVHEVKDQQRFFLKIQKVLRPGGRFLIVEPPFHVNHRAFQSMKKIAEDVGLIPLNPSKRKGGRSLLLSHGPPFLLAVLD